MPITQRKYLIAGWVTDYHLPFLMPLVEWPSGWLSRITTPHKTVSPELDFENKLRHSRLRLRYQTVTSEGGPSLMTSKDSSITFVTSQRCISEFRNWRRRLRLRHRTVSMIEASSIVRGWAPYAVNHQRWLPRGEPSNFITTFNFPLLPLIPANCHIRLRKWSKSGGGVYVIGLCP